RGADRSAGDPAARDHGPGHPRGRLHAGPVRRLRRGAQGRRRRGRAPQPAHRGAGSRRGRRGRRDAAQVHLFHAQGAERAGPAPSRMSPRPRERILANLESIYREAYERAKAAGDQARMADLDAAYQREQLLLEVLLDIRDALVAAPPAAAPDPRAAAPDPLATLAALRRISNLR